MECVRPAPGTLYAAWQSVEIGEDSYDELVALVEGSPWSIWLEKTGLVFRHESLNVSWYMENGDHVVRSPWGTISFLSAEQYREDFEPCLGRPSVPS